MSLTVGELNARLTLDSNQFNRGVDSAHDKFTGLETASSKAGAAIKNAALGGVGLINSAGAATALWTANALKTGLAYNTLQQTSRAALKTILGSSEAVNAQMDKLDAFAKTSPFGKDIFLKGQQQMLAFGTATDKVIPRLDALQNAVAASGGSADDLEGLIFVMSQIQSAGKITAEDLMQFGQRGVNAADLIGSQMGKTGQQIKSEITKGTLDANDALDALTKGMATKFAGASANVKQTWSGTTDRIKAATREIGAALAEPFISQQGSGLAVTWGNQVADILQGVRANTKPVVDILTGELTPAFGGISNGLAKLNVQVRSFNPQRVQDWLDAIKANAPAVGLLAGAWAGVSSNMLGSVPIIGGVLSKINPLGTAILGLVASSPELRDSLGDVALALVPLASKAGEVASAFSGALNAAIPVAATGLELVADVATVAVDAFDSIPVPVLAAGAALLTVVANAGKLSAVWTSVADGFSTVKTLATTFQTSMTAGSTATAAFGAAAEAAGGKVGALGKAMLFLTTNPVGLAITAIGAVLAIFAAQAADAAQKAQETKQDISELQQTLNKTTGDATADTLQRIKDTLDSLDTSTWQTGSGRAFQDFSEAAQMAGTSTDELAAAVTYGGSALDAVKSKMQAHTDSLSGNTRAQGEAEHAMGSVNAAIDEQRSELEQAEEATRRKIEADREANAALSEDARQNKSLNEALSITRDTTRDATERLTALKQALDILKGGSISAEEAQKSLAQTNLNLKDALDQTDHAGQKVWKSFVDGAGKINMDAGQSAIDFATKMGTARDQMLQAAMSAADAGTSTGDLAKATADATNASQGYVDKLRETMTQAGLTDQQIDGLIKQYLDVPSVVATAVTDNGTIGTVQQKIIQLYPQLTGLPDRKLIVSADTKQAFEGIEGVQVTQLDDKTFAISGDSEDAWNKIDDVNAAQTPGKTAWIWGNDDDALAKIGRVNGTGVGNKGFFIDAWDRATSVVESVKRQVEGLNGKTYTVTIRSQFVQGYGQVTGIGGGMQENGGFWANGVQAFANGGYTGSGQYVPRVSQMQKGGANILWAEPSTGWETYISGKADQRARNQELLRKTASLLGMSAFTNAELAAIKQVRQFANGGTVRTATTTQQVETPTGVVVNQTFNVDARGTDPGITAQVLASQMRRELGKAGVSLN